jgi:uncharacterized membrane protein
MKIYMSRTGIELGMGATFTGSIFGLFFVVPMFAGAILGAVFDLSDDADDGGSNST